MCCAINTLLFYLLFQVAIVGDGQVTAGSCIVKGKARKVRKLGDGAVISGMAGSTADCLTLLERLEGSLEKYPGQPVARITVYI